MSEKDQAIEDLFQRADYALPQVYEEIKYAVGMPPILAAPVLERAAIRLRGILGETDMAVAILNAPEPQKRAAG